MDMAYDLDPQTVSIGVLVGRLVVGLLMAAHGAQKLFGWFGGYGLEATGEFFRSIGFQPGRTFATLAGAAELGSGLLIALGLLGPIGPAVLLAVMIVAGISVHWRGGVEDPAAVVPQGGAGGEDGRRVILTAQAERVSREHVHFVER
jgi:putative oxidoreductase